MIITFILRHVIYKTGFRKKSTDLLESVSHYRVKHEFMLPGVNSDVAKFCKFYDICQRSIQKNCVTIVLGKLPLIDTPF